MTSELNWLQAAKARMMDIEGNHNVEYVKCIVLVAIADALIAIAEKVVER